MYTHILINMHKHTTHLNHIHYQSDTKKSENMISVLEKIELDIQLHIKRIFTKLHRLICSSNFLTSVEEKDYKYHVTLNIQGPADEITMSSNSPLP